MLWISEIPKYSMTKFLRLEIINHTKMQRNADKLLHPQNLITFGWDLTHSSIILIPSMIVTK